MQYPLPLADDDAGAFGDEETTSSGRERSSDADANGDDGAGDDGDEVFEQDHDESLLPLTMDGEDARGSALWVLAGLAALIIAGFIWFKLRPEADELVRADEHAVAPQAALPQTGSETDPRALQVAAGAGAPTAAEAQEVEVNIHTDVERATLLVNGEQRGEISSEQSLSLKLRPGAYRFDAQSEGTQVAVTVVTVRGDMPMDVFLELPKGASEQPQQAAKQPSQEAHAAAADDDGDSAATRARREAARAARNAAAAAKREAAEPAPIAPAPTQLAVPPGERVVAPLAPSMQLKPSPAPAKPAASPLPSSAEASAQPKPPVVAPAPAPKPQGIPDNPF